MPVVLSHDVRLELNLTHYQGAITLVELRELAEFGAANGAYLRADTLNIVRPGAYFDQVSLADLDALFAHYKTLFAPLDLQMMRRAAWLCQSPAAQPHVDHWLGRDARGGMASAVRQFNTFAEACEWLVLTGDEVAHLETGASFTELARFPRALALSR